MKGVIEQAREAMRARRRAEAAEHGVSGPELDEARAQAKERKARLSALMASGLLVHAADIDRIADSRFEVTPLIEAVSEWAADEAARPVLMLCGGLGTGKTFACGLAIASVGQGVAVRSIELAARLRPTGVELDWGLPALSLRHPLVVFEDLWTEGEGCGRRWREAFADFIEHRQMYGRTIITTSLKQLEIRDRYDPRIIDRLNQCARAVEFAGASRRATGSGL